MMKISPWGATAQALYGPDSWRCSRRACLPAPLSLRGTQPDSAAAGTPL